MEIEKLNLTKEARCSHCNYEWFTSSNKIFVSCPSCLKKTKLKDQEKNEQ